MAALILTILFSAVAAHGGDPCAAYMGRNDDEIGLVRCRDRYGGWNFGAAALSPATSVDCPWKKKNPTQPLQDITRFTERKPAVANYSAPNADQNLLAQIKQRTAKQAECAAKAPTKPQRIVIAYDGLSVTGPIPSQISSHSGQRPSGFGFGGMRSNIISNGVLRVPNTQWQYHDETQARRAGRLSDSIRCAYEWATKPYKNSKGETVYSSVTLIGYSFGGNAAFQTAETLRRLGITVDTMVTLDPRQPHTAWNAFNDRKPASVGRWVNYYERNLTMLPGYPVQGAENHRLSFFAGLTHVLASHTSEIANGVTQSLNETPVCRSSPSRVSSAPVSCN